MSNEYHRPTYSLTYPNTGAARPYNPTEVRLYGLKGTGLQVARNTLNYGTANFDFEVTVKPKSGDSKELDGKSETGTLISIATENKDQVVLLYASNVGSGDPLEAGVVFAYAYEGHCYELPKPKVMLIPAIAEDPNADDCGYDVKTDYKVWVLDKLERCVEIEVCQGFVEQLVLSANMPGQRSPSTYRATMAMSHRNGRLTDS